jgi:hypothetical protein
VPCAGTMLARVMAAVVTTGGTSGTQVWNAAGPLGAASTSQCLYSGTLLHVHACVAGAWHPTKDGSSGTGVSHAWPSANAVAPSQRVLHLAGVCHGMHHTHCDTCCQLVLRQLMAQWPVSGSQLHVQCLCMHCDGKLLGTSSCAPRPTGAVCSIRAVESVVFLNNQNVLIGTVLALTV